jgi:hypothetical protein
VFENRVLIKEFGPKKEHRQCHTKWAKKRQHKMILPHVTELPSTSVKMTHYNQPKWLVTTDMYSTAQIATLTQSRKQQKTDAFAHNINLINEFHHPNKVR